MPGGRGAGHGQCSVAGPAVADGPTSSGRAGLAWCAAMRQPSENVMVIWKNPDLARGYLAHWQDRFSKGEDYRTNY